MTFRHQVFLFSLLGAFIGLTPAAHAQSADQYRILVPYSPGGVVDLVGRRVAQRLTELTGKTVVVENKPGAVGAVAIETMKNAASDGRTLVVMDPAIVINPILQPSLSYNYDRDVKVVAMLTQSPLIVTVNGGVKANTVPDLLKIAKSTPGSINYSSAGLGTTPHMAGEMLKTFTGVDLVHVPYKGGNAATADLLSGQVQMTFMTPSIMLQYSKDGRMRALATTGAQRSALFPQLPTMEELGYKNFEVNVWVALFASKKVDDKILDKLHDEVTAAWNNAELKANLAATDVLTMSLSREEANRYIKKDEAKWATVAKSNAIKID